MEIECPTCGTVQNECIFRCPSCGKDLVDVDPIEEVDDGVR